MKKTYKYRLYPSQRQKENINLTLETCRIFYNDCLAERKEAWEKEQRKITCFEQINSLPSKKESNSFLSKIFSQILQDIVRRVHKNFQAFFRRLKDPTVKAGYPRFKSFGRYDSFTYPQHGFKLVKSQVKLSQIGWVNIRKHRTIEGEVKTCSILVKNGKYYACFSCEVEPNPLPKTDKKAGVDLGLISFVATSDGDKQSTPKFYRQAEQKLTQLQTQADRKQHKRGKTDQTRASKGYKKAKLKIALECEKVANQRKDLAHKLSRELVKKYDFLACEKLEIRGMVEKGERKNNRYSVKSINDAGWRLFVNLLLCKAEEAGKEVKLVDPKNTTQMCSNCHNLASPKLARSERIYNCSFCGYSEDRDVNAAKNILWKATTESGTDLVKQVHAV